MDFLIPLLRSMPGAVGQGLIWGIMAIGVYLTYRILDVADLTVDGSLATGGAVCVLLTVNGCNIWVAVLCAILAGMLAGLATGLFHTFCGIPAILSGILTQLALYSINLRIMGFGTDAGTRASLAVSVNDFDLLVSQRYIRDLSWDNRPAEPHPPAAGPHRPPDRGALLVLRHRAGLLPPSHRLQPQHGPGPGH